MKTIPRIKIMMGENLRGRRDEREWKREKRKEKELRERERKKEWEESLWKEVGVCVAGTRGQ